MSDFRFEQLEIWKDAIEVSDRLFDIADLADKKKLYKFAEQLRSAVRVFRIILQKDLDLLLKKNLPVS